MKYYAEYVSRGHPDRLCDQIVERIVTYVVSKDKDALCGLECAVHTNKVFVDGRIAAGKEEIVIDNEKIKEIVKQVYQDSHYGENNLHGHIVKWHPYPDELEIYLDVCIETLSDDERDLRKYSDDQNVVNGYAINSPNMNYLPIAHYIANIIGEHYFGYRDEYIGPDYKILVQISDDNGKYEWDRFTISTQHKGDTKFETIYKSVKKDMEALLRYHLKGEMFDSLHKIEEKKFYLNGAGDFIQGGPEGDNGLSGKKLCIDFYGPEIPIGGGAISGKDPHKIDVCGAFRARELALKLVKEYGFYSVFTSLAWSPGEKYPHSIKAYSIDQFGTRMEIDESLLPPKDWFSIECINNDLKLNEIERDKTLMSGYMFSIK